MHCTRDMPSESPEAMVQRPTKRSRLGPRYTTLQIGVPVPILPAMWFPREEVMVAVPWADPVVREDPVTREALQGEEECYICYHNFPDAKFTPCGNRGVCCACAQRITRSTGKCPLCSLDVTSFERE